MATFFWKDFPDMDHMHFYVTYRKFPHQGLVGSSAPSCCIFQVYIPTNDCTHITTPTPRAWQQAAKSRGLTRCHGPRPAGHAHFFIIFSHFVHHFRFAALGWGLLVSSALCGAGYFDPSAPHSHYIRNSSAFFWMLTNEPAAVNRGKIMLKPNDQWSLASWVFSCVGIFWHSNISAWYSWIQNFIQHSNLFDPFWIFFGSSLCAAFQAFSAMSMSRYISMSSVFIAMFAVSITMSTAITAMSMRSMCIAMSSMTFCQVESWGLLQADDLHDFMLLYSSAPPASNIFHDQGSRISGL